jgi:hypothetical protein
MMPKFNLKKISVPDLLRLLSEILDELKAQDVIRTRNNPVSDYAEWLVSEKMNLELVPPSKSGYDAVGADGKRYQIKSRRLDPKNKSRQLSVIRKLKAKEFDYLIGIIFDKDFSVKEAYKIPHRVIGNFGRFSKHQNGHILHLRGEILKASGVKNITKTLKKS